MNDRRPLIAVALIIVIALAPMLFLKTRKPVTGSAADSTHVAAHDSTPRPAPVIVPTTAAPPVTVAQAAPATPERLVVVRSGLYRYVVSSTGGRIVSSRILHYQSMNPADRRDTLELIRPGSALLAARLVTGNDTVPIDRIAFTPSADSLTASTEPATLTLTGTSGAYTVQLHYLFSPNDYRIYVDGQVTGLGPTGGTLLVGLGDGFRDTEASAADNRNFSAFVTKTDKTNLTRFSSLKAQSVSTVSGPFEWVAVKSKYFVGAVFAYDSTAQGVTARLGGLLVTVPDTDSHPIKAAVSASLTVPAQGHFSWSVYLGPMEYDRLSHIGHGFDDVNPYGWTVFRWIVRPCTVAIRAVFVWMHHVLGVGYGLVIVLFGVAVRLALWPLYRKQMRATMAMQAIQPLITELQERYKEDPAQLNREMMKLYKEHNANPLSGCWPMLLPYPLLVAVFFVLAYTIEVRGVPFLWMPDLSRADPLYIIPVLMAVTQLVLARISQIGMPPNPQTKMMMYLMPVFMLVIFIRFASGLNLYYAAQNLASLPQQWALNKERQRAMAAQTPPPKVQKKK
ncbi:MAG TPA: membrane protein insertase YidC [Gemmatimonadales bacterium]|nr:membrane protein insertase YidC [Gemmatimonadales bacterium]